MDIVNRFTNEVLRTIDRANLQGADLQGANLQGANLWRANLWRANLQGADLQGANLWGETLKSNPFFINGMRWPVVITNGYMKIGCQRHSHNEWLNFTNTDISNMHLEALQFWEKFKEHLLAMCAIQERE